MCVKCICGDWFPVNSKCDYCQRTLEEVEKEEEVNELKARIRGKLDEKTIKIDDR